MIASDLVRRGFPLHPQCGGPLVPASLLGEGGEDKDALICAKCRARTGATPEELRQSSEALRAVLALAPSFIRWALGALAPRPPTKKKRQRRQLRLDLKGGT